MDLFVVNRYLGEDATEAEEEEDRAAREEKILAKLNAKVWKNKKLEDVQDGVTDFIPNEEAEVDRSKSKKNKRKMKLGDSSYTRVAEATDVNDDVFEGDTNRIVKCNANKRVRWDESVIVNENEVNETCDIVAEGITDVSEMAVKMKKKKKKVKELQSLESGEATQVAKEECHAKKKKKKKGKYETDRDEHENSSFLDSHMQCDNSVGSEQNSGQEDDRQETEEKHISVKNDVGGFTVLGEVTTQKRAVVKQVLPPWLAHPHVFSADLEDHKMAVSDVTGLDCSFADKLKNNGITNFFPVQYKVIPWLLDSFTSCHYRPSDICVCAPTGSGKTLVFVLPIVQALKNRVVTQIRALVVLPVQDLALQVYGVFQKYCAGTKLKVALLTGRNSFADEQENLFKKGVRGSHCLVDIVVATPGRLMDHIWKTPGFSLKYLRFLVLDEADRLMDNDCVWLKHVEKKVYMAEEADGFQRQMPGVITAVNVQKMEIPLQKLLFSATLSQEPEKLQQISLFEPILFTAVAASSLLEEKKEAEVDDREADSSINPEIVEDVEEDIIGTYTTPEKLNESYVVCDQLLKPLILYHLITSQGWKHVLCFTNSKENTHRLCILLKHLGGLNIGELSSNLRPALRTKQLKLFENGVIDVLVCTDSLARGMDIPSVHYVVSYNLPRYVKGYIHRVGRTARAGRAGTAVSLVEYTQVSMLKNMISSAGKAPLTKMKVSNADLKPLEDRYQHALEELKSAVEVENKTLKAKADRLQRKQFRNKKKKKLPSVPATTLQKKKKSEKKVKHHLK